MAYRCYREWLEEHSAEFLSRGLPRRDFFPHRCWFLPKCGPEGMYLAGRLCGVSDPRALWQVVMFATGEELEGLPPELFYDDDVIWHRQHFGQPGHIAYAKIVKKGTELYVTNYQSDVVQRISRRPEFKSRIKGRFHGWPELLFNSVMAFAVECGATRLYSPTPDLVMRHTNPLRDVKRQLFDIVYDRAVNRRCDARRQGDWWVIDVAANRDRVVMPERKRVPHDSGKRICVCHDLERGWGSRRTDPALARQADDDAARNLEAMLAAESAAGVRATYHVVGEFFEEVREPIAEGGHCLAFHSYDHTASPLWRIGSMRSRIAARADRMRGIKRRRQSGDQLRALRRVDRRVKGFRPPQSRISSEWSDQRLGHRNFEWLASSAASLRICRPAIENGLVKIPVTFDDYPMYRGSVDYEEWERRALQVIEREPFVAFCTHDCYAPWWLSRYRRFLDRVLEHGRVATLDEIADATFLDGAR